MRPLTPLILTKAQQTTLEAIIRSRQLSHSLVQRAQIVLNAGIGHRNKVIAQELGLQEETVGLWRRRWLLSQEALAAGEDDPALLRRQIETILADAERPGAPHTFSAEQVCQLLALACETPPAPLTHWTRKDLAREAVNRGIVDCISETSIGRFLKAGPAKTTSDAVLAQSVDAG